ncbi:MAG: hypothetical protein M3P45_08450 [Acidobacteriota bacterium]|nr:hypothetical protein [Acidobacteriota bacterium]
MDGSGGGRVLIGGVIVTHFHAGHVVLGWRRGLRFPGCGTLRRRRFVNGNRGEQNANEK